MHQARYLNTPPLPYNSSRETDARESFVAILPYGARAAKTKRTPRPDPVPASLQREKVSEKKLRKEAERHHDSRIYEPSEHKLLAALQPSSIPEAHSQVWGQLEEELVRVEGRYRVAVLLHLRAEQGGDRRGGWQTR